MDAIFKPAALAMGAALAGLAVPAAAQDVQGATEALRFQGAAAPACVVGGVTAGSATNATFAALGEAGGTINITQLVDPETAEPRQSDIALDLPVVCNAAHRLIIESRQGGLLRQGGSSSNVLADGVFADLLPYRIDLAWGSIERALASNDGTSVNVVDGARMGDLRMRISTAAGGGALTAGRYDDTITIRLEPAS